MKDRNEIVIDNSYLVMLGNVREEQLSKILASYELNPIILWEVILR